MLQIFITKNKSRKNIAEHLHDLIAPMHGADHMALKDDFYKLGKKLLSHQNHSRSWRKIDRELKKSLNKLDYYINEGYMNAAGNYEPWIRKLIDARGRKQQGFPVTEDERELFEFKEQLYETTDEINKHYAKKQKIARQLRRLPLDKSKAALQMDLKLCGNDYIAAKKAAEEIAGNIYVIVSTGKLTEQAEFYKKFRDGQILPEKVEQLTLRLGFYQEQVSTSTKESTEHIDNMYEELNDEITEKIDDIEEYDETLEDDYIYEEQTNINKFKIRREES